MLKKIIATIIAAAIVSAPTQAQAAPAQAREYTQVYSDMQGSDLTLKRTERMVKYVENHISYIRPNRLYSIEKFKGFEVIVVMNTKGRRAMWNAAETRTRPMVVVEYGWKDNAQGDGHTGDGCYTGYRVQGQPMQFDNYRGIRTITVLPGTDQYTDSIAYRKDVQR